MYTRGKNQSFDSQNDTMYSTKNRYDDKKRPISQDEKQKQRPRINSAIRQRKLSQSGQNVNKSNKLDFNNRRRVSSQMSGTKK